MSLITFQRDFSEHDPWVSRFQGNILFTSFLAAAVDSFQGAASHSDFASTSPSDRTLLKAKQPSCWCRCQWQKQEIWINRDRLREMQKSPEKPNTTPLQSNPSSAAAKSKPIQQQFRIIVNSSGNEWIYAELDRKYQQTNVAVAIAFAVLLLLLLPLFPSRYQIHLEKDVTEVCLRYSKYINLYTNRIGNKVPKIRFIEIENI